MISEVRHRSKIRLPKWSVGCDTSIFEVYRSLHTSFWSLGSLIYSKWWNVRYKAYSSDRSDPEYIRKGLFIVCISSVVSVLQITTFDHYIRICLVELWGHDWTKLTYDCEIWHPSPLNDPKNCQIDILIRLIIFYIQFPSIWCMTSLGTTFSLVFNKIP